jgi:hypothetical protein
MHRFTPPAAALALITSSACYVSGLGADGNDTDPSEADDDAGPDADDDGADESGDDGPADESGDDGPTDDSGDDSGPPPEGGHLAFVLEGELYVMPAEARAPMRALTSELDALASGLDEDFVQISADGEWLLISSERFDPRCAGYPCLSVLPIDAGSAEAVIDANGEPLRGSSGNGAILTRGGSAIVYSAEGTHTRDLYYTSDEGEAWSAPTLLTAESPYAYNAMPRLDVDEQRVVFDCGDQPYGDVGTAICEVGIDGSGLRVVWAPDQAPRGTEPGGFLHHPSYTPGGGIVFEAAWSGEQVWVLEPGATEPVLLRPDHENDNAPCVLPDGRVASLWLGREGGSGLHELTLKSADGETAQVLLLDRDVADVGLGCGS